MNRTLVTTLLLAGLCAGACSSAATPAPATAAPSGTPGAGGAAPTKVPSVPGSPAAGLEGRTFISVKVAGHDLVKGSTVSMTFKASNISVNAGCNTMGGAYTITGTRLAIGPLMSTEMGCDQGLMAQDQWLSALLSAGMTLALDAGTLTLSQAQTTLTLQDRKIVNPDRPLEGTTWVLNGIVSTSTVSSVPAGPAASLTITNGTAAVDTGCNSGSAPVTIDGGTITFGPLSLTKKACSGDAAVLEQGLTTVLKGTVKFTIDADALTLDAGGGGLTFLASK